jgi:hypothetical protein
MTSYPPDDEDALGSAPVSADAITPRGGFMARPGLKSPPRHAVVVRGGDTPDSEHIPRLRPSGPPPPPVSEPPPPASASEMITLRAIPTPTPPAAKAEAVLAASALPVVDSWPPSAPAPSSRAPLSDAPFVTSTLETASGPSFQKPSGSRWTIVAAAAAGLLLGLGSVAAKLSAPSAAAQPPPADTLSVAEVKRPLVPAAPAVVDSAATAKRASTPAPSSQRAESKPSRPAAPSAKRSIF